MNKLFIALAFLFAGFTLHAQELFTFRQLTAELHGDPNTTETYSDYHLDGKMFTALRDSTDHSERLIIDFQPNNQIVYSETLTDKQTGKNTVNNFMGDIVRRGNILSIRADQLEGQRIAVPIVFNMLLLKDKDVYYLLDINRKEVWLDTKYLDAALKKEKK